jgi:hypothetical protein
VILDGERTLTFDLGFILYIFEREFGKLAGEFRASDHFSRKRHPAVVGHVSLRFRVMKDAPPRASGRASVPTRVATICP